jgi:hypothetical protein
MQRPMAMFCVLVRPPSELPNLGLPVKSETLVAGAPEEFCVDFVAPFFACRGIPFGQQMLTKTVHRLDTKAFSKAGLADLDFLL